MGGNESFAEDVAQEALTRAYAAWNRISEHPNLEAWVTTTAFHVALEFSRQQKRAGRTDGSPKPVDVPGQEQRVADADELARALRRLSSRQQQVVVWRYYFDQSVEETAGRLGLTSSKVKDATHEAVTKLGRLLRTDEGRRDMSWRDDLPEIPEERIRTEAIREGCRRRDARLQRQRAVLFGGMGVATVALVVFAVVQHQPRR